MELTEAERMRRKEEFEVEKGKLLALLSEQGGNILHLGRVAGAFFAEESEGKTYKRRPNLAINIPAEGDPSAHLAITPGWCRREKALDLTRLRFELLVRRIGLSGCPKEPTVEIGLSVNGQDVRPGTWSGLWGVDSLRRLIATVDGFLVDPFASFARSSDRCCICRRLRPLPYRSNEPSVACRVRSLLKAALRAHRLRCVAVQVIKKAAAGGGEGDQA